MKKYKICNLYSGIGGNRKLWGDNHDITAVEMNPKIAKEYKRNFPNDGVIIADAHQFLLENFDKFDVIWSSPPCPTHSDIRRCGVHKGQYEAKYPEMELYQEIILLQNFTPKKTKWIVENVIPYYTPLMPGKKLGRHLYWSNFTIPEFVKKDKRIHSDITGRGTVYGFNIKNTDIKDKRKTLRNMVNPELGLHILNHALGIIEKQDLKQINIFD